MTRLTPVRSFLAGLTVGLAVIAISTSIRAQTQPAPDPSVAFQAEGDRAWAGRDFAAAERAYRLGWDDRLRVDGEAADRTAVVAVGLVRSLQALGRVEEAGVLRRRMIAARRANWRKDDTILALLLMLEGQAATQDGRFDDAIEPTMQASNLYFGAEQLQLAGAADLALAGILTLRGRHQEALQAAQSALDYGGPDIRGQALIARGNSLVNLGDLREGERDYIDALNLAPERDPMILADYASVLVTLGDTEVAIDVFTEALSSFDAMGPAGAQYRPFVLDGLGLARLSQRRADDAEALFRLAIAAADETPDGLRRRIYSRSNLSKALMMQGRHAEAEPLLRAAVSEIAAVDGEASFNWGVAVLNLTDLLQKQDRHAEALPLIRRAFDAQAAAVGTQSSALTPAWTQLGHSLSAVEGPSASEEAFRQAAELSWNSLPSGHPYVADRVLDFARQRLEADAPLEALSGLRLASEAVAGRMASSGQTLQLEGELDSSRLMFGVQVEAAWRLAAKGTLPQPAR